MSSTVLKDFKEDIKGFETTKASIRFTQEKPIPNDLITRIVMARVAENELKVITRQRTKALSRLKVLH